jgi:hypothetical protein
MINERFLVASTTCLHSFNLGSEYDKRIYFDGIQVRDVANDKQGFLILGDEIIYNEENVN